jgi:hypothetical protein
MNPAIFIAGVAALFLATGTAHAQDTLITSRGVKWKCHDGIIVRFDSVGEKREEGASTTLISTGLPRLGPNSLHIVESKDSKRELVARKLASPYICTPGHCPRKQDWCAGEQTD